jgi:ketosteroid isomerase-like protein
MTTSEKHDKAVEAFNNHDADKVVEFYSPDAILTELKQLGEVS